MDRIIWSFVIQGSFCALFSPHYFTSKSSIKGITIPCLNQTNNKQPVRPRSETKMRAASLRRRSSCDDTTSDDISALRLSHYSRSEDNNDEDDSLSSRGRPGSLPRMTVNNITMIVTKIGCLAISLLCLALATSAVISTNVRGGGSASMISSNALVSPTTRKATAAEDQVGNRRKLQTRRTPTAPPTTRKPTSSPTRKPTPSPTSKPTTNKPTSKPTATPTTSQPTVSPTSKPTTNKPTSKPTASPSNIPTRTPTNLPTSKPSSSVSTFVFFIFITHHWNENSLIIQLSCNTSYNYHHSGQQPNSLLKLRRTHQRKYLQLSSQQRYQRRRRQNLLSHLMTIRCFNVLLLGKP